MSDAGVTAWLLVRIRVNHYTDEVVIVDVGIYGERYPTRLRMREGIDLVLAESRSRPYHVAHDELREVYAQHAPMLARRWPLRRP